VKCLYVAAKYVVVAAAVLLYFGLVAKKMFRCWSAAVHVVWQETGTGMDHKVYGSEWGWM